MGLPFRNFDSTSLINQFVPVKRVELLSTHPMSAARAARLKAELATLPKFLPEPFAFEWEKVQAALKAGDAPPRP